MRAVIGVVVGYVLWTALWLGGNAAFFSEASAVVQGGEAYIEPKLLAGIVGLSIVCSLAAGFATARIAGKGKAVLVLAGLLLATGVAVQAGVWSLMPVWYHLTFLALLVPVTLVGARLAGSTRN